MNRMQYPLLHFRPRLACRFALAFFLFASCTTLPESSSPQSVSYVSLVEQQIGLYKDSALEKQVRRLGYRLVGESQLPREQFSFYILDQEIPNAFAAPDGSIYVSRGLLALTNSEDALAAILAHEIAHILLRHHLKQTRRKRLPNLLKLPGMALGNVVDERVGAMVNAPIESLGRIYLASHGRAEESEADLLGIRLAARSGYRPEAMATILGQMEASMSLLFGDRENSSFFDSHPATPGRIDEILKLASEIEIPASVEPPQFATPERYRQSLEGLCFGPNPAYGTQSGNRFLHPVLGFGLDIPVGWKLLRTTSVVGVTAPDERSGFFFGLAHYGYDVSAVGQRMKDLFYEEFRITPMEEDFVLLPSGSRFSTVYRDHSGEQPIFVYFTWVELDGSIFQFVGFDKEPPPGRLAAVIESISLPDPEALNRLTLLNLRLVRARSGETIPQLGQRTGNQWSPRFTAIANKLPEDFAFQGGELVKIIRREPYHIPPSSSAP